jgi:hemolysin III
VIDNTSPGVDRLIDSTPEASQDPRPLLRGWLHVVAFAGVLIAGPLLIISGRDLSQRFYLTVYVASLAALFGVSAAFHRVRWGPSGRRRMRRADHACIFVAIAGSYTAIAGLVLTGWAQAAILTIVWGGTVVGIVVRQTWLDAPKWVIAVPYVVVGWSGLVVLSPLIHGLGVSGVLLIVGGGLAYTVGAIVYGMKRPDVIPGVFGYHELFHLCTIIGATLQFVAIAAIALPAASR